MVRITSLLCLAGCVSPVPTSQPNASTADTADTSVGVTTETADTGGTTQSHPWTALWTGDPLSRAGFFLATGSIHQDGAHDLLIAVQGGVPWVENPGSEWTGAALVHGLPASGILRDVAEVTWDYGIDKWQGGAVALPGDITGDGVPDVAIGIYEYSAERIEVFSESTGLLGPPAQVIEGSTNPFTVGDLDGDGVAELDVANGHVLAGPLPASSTSEDAWFEVDAPTGRGAHSDYDGDGTPDMLWSVNDEADTGGYLFLDVQPGSATLQDADVRWTPEGLLTGDPTSLVVLDGGQDLSGDGVLDIVFSGASSAGDRLLGYVVTDLSGGSLAGATTRFEGDPGASVLAGTMGDFDGDGASDLALSVGCEPNEVVVFRGPLAAGTLTPADADVRIESGSCGGYDEYVRSMESGDLDGDGRDDLVMGFNNAVGVLAGGGL